MIRVPLLLSLIAIGLAARTVTSTKTYGYYRFEYFGGIINGITLFVVAGLIVWEAIGRFFEPPTVASGPMNVNRINWFTSKFN